MPPKAGFWSNLTQRICASSSNLSLRRTKRQRSLERVTPSRADARVDAPDEEPVYPVAVDRPAAEHEGAHRVDHVLLWVHSSGERELFERGRAPVQPGVGERELEVRVPVAVVALERMLERGAHPRQLVQAAGDPAGQDVRVRAEWIQRPGTVEIGERAGGMAGPRLRGAVGQAGGEERKDERHCSAHGQDGTLPQPGQQPKQQPQEQRTAESMGPP